MRQHHIKTFNIDDVRGREEYEKLMNKVLAKPTQFHILGEPKRVMKSKSAGDLESKETWQEIWYVVEYIEETPDTKKNNDKSIFN